MLFTCILSSVIAAAPVPATKAEELKKEQEANWASLLKDESEATRALLKFSMKPKETTAFFKEKMKPLVIDEKQVRKLIEELASDDEKVWKKVEETFQYFDPRLAMSLQKCVEETQPGEHRGRMIMILSERPISSLKEYNVDKMNLRSTGPDSFNFSDGQLSWWAEHKVKNLGKQGWSGKNQWSRASRALILLEHFGTDDACEVLKSMATGHEDASPTVVAKAALKRIGK